MATDKEGLVRPGLNSPAFQEQLTLQRPERLSTLDTLAKLQRMNWSQAYRDRGLKRERIASVKPLAGTGTVHSLRNTRSRRATAWRDGDFIRPLTIPPDHDGTHGRE
ncbi:MAG TPA: hypothetical protein PKH69_03150 [Thiobacillaceae bacterium]|nr:hypothetical protein [Thiobacillaceae bacterium]HNU63085.1 hypothetical protein [Thiobacillaceae bacterium]